ncbi:MAG: DedA family protein [Vulcanimicrobiaceae bacterium]
MGHLTAVVLGIVEHAGYPGLFAVMALGNMGMPVGTEVVVPAAGALVATGHLSSLWLAGLVATFGELVGGTILFAVGYFGGRPFVARYGRFLRVDDAKLDRFHAFYERHGSVVVFVCRFIPFVRGVSALPAGVSRMGLAPFLAYTALGSAVFCFGLAWLGSLFGHHLDDIAPRIHGISLAVLLALVVAAVAGFAYLRRRTA